MDSASGRSIIRPGKPVENAYIESFNCYDNAAMKSFFGTLKPEYFRLNVFNSVEVLKGGIRRSIHYYNNDRIKLTANGLNPVMLGYTRARKSPTSNAQTSPAASLRRSSSLASQPSLECRDTRTRCDGSRGESFR